MDRLVARLTTGGNASVSAGGTGGAGKTTLAVKLAYDPRILAHYSDGVLWAALGKDPTIEAILTDWAGALHLDVSSIAEPAGRAQAIKNAVGLRSILFIIDDVWDDAAANVLRCGGPNCAHLLTTRDDGIARAFAGPSATERVPELEPDPAFELLQALAPEVCAAEPEAARRLVREVGGLPLAIELLGGYLGDPARTGLAGSRAEALREMSDPTRRLRLAHERLGGRTGERPTLEQTIALSLDDLPEEVVHAFHCLGAFSPKPDTFDPVTAQIVANATSSCLGLLLRRRLIEIPEDEHTQGERLSIHPVIAEYARSRMSTDAVAKHRAAYEELLDSSENDWRIIEREYAQIRHAWSQLDHDEPGKIAFVYRVQNYQRLRGLWSDKLSWTEDALELATRKQLNSEIAVTLNNIGHVYSALGQRQRALEYYERALPIREEVGDRQGLAVTLNNIGHVYSVLGQRERALEYYERTLPIREEVGDRQGLAVTLNNIGGVYNAEGQRQRALEYYERALPITEEVGDRQGLAVTLHNIAGVYDAQGQRQKAVEYYERALPIIEEVGDRAGEAITRFNLGAIYRREGRLVDAVEQLRLCVELDEAVQHPDLDSDRAVLREVEAELAAQVATATADPEPPSLLQRVKRLFRRGE